MPAWEAKKERVAPYLIELFDLLKPFKKVKSRLDISS
jgi:hypothetical protein